MVEKVASVNNNTIVVVNSVGPIIMESWIENPNGENRLVNTELFVRLMVSDRKSTRLNSSHSGESRMPSSA